MEILVKIYTFPSRIYNSPRGEHSRLEGCSLASVYIALMQLESSTYLNCRIFIYFLCGRKCNYLLEQCDEFCDMYLRVDSQMSKFKNTFLEHWLAITFSSNSIILYHCIVCVLVSILHHCTIDKVAFRCVIQFSAKHHWGGGGGGGGHSQHD